MAREEGEDGERPPSAGRPQGAVSCREGIGHARVEPALVEGARQVEGALAPGRARAAAGPVRPQLEEVARPARAMHRVAGRRVAHRHKFEPVHGEPVPVAHRLDEPRAADGRLVLHRCPRARRSDELLRHTRSRLAHAVGCPSPRRRTSWPQARERWISTRRCPPRRRRAGHHYSCRSLASVTPSPPWLSRAPSKPAASGCRARKSRTTWRSAPVPLPWMIRTKGSEAR